MRISKKTRLQVLKRDGECCRVCGGREKLELHHLNHLISAAELEKDGFPARGINAPENLVTLCWCCHSVTYGNKTLKYWLTPEEINGLKLIRSKRAQQSSLRDKVKEQFRGIWDTPSYQEKKKELTEEIKSLDLKEEELLQRAKERLRDKQQKVLRELSLLSLT